MLNTYQFVLTDKGEKLLEKLMGSKTLGSAQERINDLLYLISVADDNPLDEPEVIGLLQSLTRRGLVEKDTRTVSELLGTLPTGVRSSLDVYSRLASELPVRDSEIENLRRTLVEGLTLSSRGVGRDPDKKGAPNYAELEDLKSAKTRSEKVLAIDGAIRLQHGGEGYHVPYLLSLGTGETLDAEGDAVSISKILNRLASE